MKPEFITIARIPLKSKKQFDDVFNLITDFTYVLDCHTYSNRIDFSIKYDGFHKLIRSLEAENLKEGYEHTKILSMLIKAVEKVGNTFSVWRRNPVEIIQFYVPSIKIKKVGWGGVQEK